MDNDLINKIKAQLYDRASSPVLIAFFVSWITWNIRALIVIFSKGSIKEKLASMDSLYPHTLSYPTQGVLYPAICSLIFITIYPYIAKLAFWHWNREHNKIKKIQQTQDDDKPATQEEINALRKITLEKELILESEIRILSNANREYTQREKELMIKINQDDESIRSLQAELMNSSDKFNKLKENIDTLGKSKEVKQDVLGSEIFDSSEKNEFIRYLRELDTNDLIENDEQINKLIDKVIDLSKINKISLAMLKVIFILATHDGHLSTNNMKNLLREELSTIEVKDTFNKLTNIGYIYADSSDSSLDRLGEAFVVESGITALIKKLNI